MRRSYLLCAVLAVVTISARTIAAEEGEGATTVQEPKALPKPAPVSQKTPAPKPPMPAKV